MSNIEKIKAEIEKRITDNTFGAKLELIDLLAFIDSLPEEKPSEELEEAAEEYRRKSCNAVMIPPVDGPTNEYGGSVKNAFKAGAEWQKVQMMKEAVEGEIGYWNQRGLSILPDKSLERLGYNESTRVKIIIVKEDDKG